ncbi:hypothetical protein VD0002_g3615 [Verticillium dahliae]|uniref:Retinol dehydrogenase n=2 Tax=Verticillium dahliae TaxID=27337 RepID=G2X2K7_VERDV|nr:retinol dehydrogenase [Verticillium dahliae VdLs.17]KAH6700112.1 retinol dehydrogenase [Verticillium dahliae]EGY23093.1 retinol dehydrogenase [Verticillium dahliae VdLs.17]PNH31875.1 hypothetical protein BJF96_g4665 [Verticillium dahliae]PNH44122.1 hypothetical protein VD0004_g3502 [Verticillium dahliae]PNH52148.1 hypothetical protein VD0003_g5132 [Verticillium dahliae]
MGFLQSQLLTTLPYPTESYEGKTIVITGSNVGLGKEAARHFARLGASRLILAVRSQEKGTAAKEDIESTTKCDTKVIQVWNLDMSSYASVKAFAARVEAELDRVDMFCANAGIATSEYEPAEGNEKTITINVISTFLLAALVMPKLKATAQTFGTRPTLTITASEVHAWTDLPQRSAEDGQIYNTLNQNAREAKAVDDYYPISKLLEVFGVRSIAEQSPAATFPVTVNCVNPGLCHSELSRNTASWAAVRFSLFKWLLARTTEAGSRTIVHAASQGADTHGQYMSDAQISQPGSFVLSDEGKNTQDRVWCELLERLEVIQPGVTKNFL